MSRIRALLGLFLATVIVAASAAEIRPLSPREILAGVGPRNVRLTLVVFSPREYSVRVIDNAAANDTARFPRLHLAMPALGAAAGCNGSFFNQHPFEPVGLMVGDGIRAGTFDPQSWMQGLMVVRHGRLGFEVAAEFQDGPAVTQAIQSGPWLVRSGQAVANGDTRRAHRTFICRGADGRWALGAASEPCTLGQLATALRSEEATAALDVQEALNFDGGPSTGLWVKGDHGDYSLPDQWAVRNYVALFPRDTVLP